MIQKYSSVQSDNVSQQGMWNPYNKHDMPPYMDGHIWEQRTDTWCTDLDTMPSPSPTSVLHAPEHFLYPRTPSPSQSRATRPASTCSTPRTPTFAMHDATWSNNLHGPEPYNNGSASMMEYPSRMWRQDAPNDMSRLYTAQHLTASTQLSTTQQLARASPVLPRRPMRTITNNPPHTSSNPNSECSTPTAATTPPPQVSWVANPPQALLVLVGVCVIRQLPNRHPPAPPQSWTRLMDALHSQGPDVIAMLIRTLLNFPSSQQFTFPRAASPASTLSTPSSPQWSHFSTSPLPSPRAPLPTPTSTTPTPMEAALQAASPPEFLAIIEEAGRHHLRTKTGHLPLDAGLWDLLQQVAARGQAPLLHAIIDNCLKWEDPSGLASRSSKPVANVRGYLYRKLKQKISMLQQRPDVVHFLDVLREEEPTIAEHVDGHTLQHISDNLTPALNADGSVREVNDALYSCVLELRHAATADWLHTGWGNIKVLVFSVVKSCLQNMRDVQQLLGPGF